METPHIVSPHELSLNRLDRTVEQLRTRIETNFDSINSLLREVAEGLSTLKVQLPLQKEAIDDLKVKTSKLEVRVNEMEKLFATARGMTTGAKWLWGCIIALISFLISNIAKLASIFSDLTH